MHGEDRKDILVQVNRVAFPKKDLAEDGFSIEIKEKDGVLSITEKKDVSVGMVKYKSVEYSITLILPRKTDIKLVGRDDDYKVDSLEGKLELDADDGKSEIIGYLGPEMRVKLEKGNLKTLGGGTGNLFIRMEDGNLKIQNSIFKDITATLGSGNLRAHTRFSDVHTHRFSIDDGEMDLDLFGNGGKVEARTEGGEIEASPEFKIEKRSDGFMRFTIGDGFGKIFATSRDGRIDITKKDKGF